MSASRKEDPRTIRTKELFKQAVFSLLSNDSTISNLTVQKVAAEAQLNRTTFYLHYQDIHDLLSQITEALLDELSDKIADLMHTEDLSNKQKLTKMLDYLYTHRNHLLSLFKLDQFEDQLFALLKQLVTTRRENSGMDFSENFVSVDVRTASLAGIIMWWMRKGLHFSSDYMADQINLMYKK